MNTRRVFISVKVTPALSGSKKKKKKKKKKRKKKDTSGSVMVSKLD